MWLKRIGHSIEMGTQEIDRKEYLNILRELSKINNTFFRHA